MPVTRLDTERQYRHLVQSVTDYAIYLLSLDGFVSSWNSGAQRLKGYTAENIIGKHFSCFYPDEDRLAGQPAEALRIARQTGRYEAQGWRMRQDGSRFLASVIIDLVRNDAGAEIGFAKITKDITEQAAAQKAIAASDARFRHLVQSVTDYAIYMLDLDGVVVNWNIGAERAKGYRAEEIVGQYFSCFYTPQDREKKIPQAALMTAWETGRFEGEGWRLRKDGTTFWAFVIIDIIKDDDGNAIGFAKITRDMTAEKRQADKIEGLLTLDQLTGLLNRGAFREKLTTLLSDRRQRSRVAVVLIDLDHFKAVNDKFGHLAGDLVIQETGQRIAGALRAGDLAARLGGDEFALILKIDEADDIAPLMERFVKAISHPLHLNDNETISVSASLGVRLANSDKSDIDTELRKADIALYEAKSAGRSRFCIFSDALQEQAAKLHSLERDLRRAIFQSKELEVHYQPIVDLATGRVTAREALSRWRHPEYGAIPPSDFIPVAETSGLIVPLGFWVLRRACLDAKAWEDNVPVAVNVSALQLDHDFAQALMAILAETTLAPRRL